MLFCQILSKGRKVYAKSVFKILSLLLLFFLLTGTVEALQTALVRVNDGSVYQIRFRMGDLNPDDYGVDDFVKDFSIYDQEGQEKLCLATDEEVTWELYTAARVLAATPLETPLFDDSALAEALNQAVIDLGLNSIEDELSGLIIGKIIDDLLDDTSLEVLDVASYLSGPVKVIIETASHILKFQTYRLEYQRLFNAGSRANRYANTARHLQLLANQRATVLWHAINAGEVIDIFGNPFEIKEDSVVISDDIGLLDPLHLRVVAQVYENYAGYAVSVVTALGKDTDTFTIDDLSLAVINAGAKFVGTDTLLGFLSTAGDETREEQLLNLLNTRLIDEITRIFSEKINAVYKSAASVLNLYGFCVSSAPETVRAIEPIQLTLGGSEKTIDVEQYFSSENDLTYEVKAIPSNIATASVSGSRVTIKPVSADVTTVVVTARDTVNTDLTAIQTISVVVISPRVAIDVPHDPVLELPEGSNPHSKGLREGVSVIIQNVPLTGPGLYLRSDPWIGNNEIRMLWDGATGIITDGPEENNGYTWWEIDWDQVDIKEVWSVDAFGGDQLLFRRPPDLEIINFDVSDSEVSIGEEFQLEVEIKNNGPGESAATDVYFYYHSGSRNDDLEELSEETDLRIPGTGELRVPSLEEGQRRTLTLTVDAPNTPDRYYYGALLPDNVHDSDYKGDLTESMFRNNLASEERVMVTGHPDYIVESISVRETTLDPGEEFDLRVTILNQGLGEPTSSADLDYYRSSDALISTSDRWVGDDSVSKLDTDETGKESINLTAPTAPGVYYYGACVSEVANESNRNNNCSAAVAITVRNLQTVDVNRDGVVNILDLVLVASSFGATGANDADVNGDGIVNIQDLVLVANAFGNSASAPATYSQTTNSLDASDVQQWLTQAQQLNLTDATSQRGILFLEQLFAVLTPKKTSLLPNYPNPFNPETWIPYQLAKPADVSISIYTADGKLVRTLVIGHQTVGIYQGKDRAAHWDGKNALGESVASGVYFYTLQAGDFTATRKMLIRK